METASAYHLDENVVLDRLLTQIPLDAAAKAHIRTRAEQMIVNIRSTRKTFGGLDKFLQEFGLTTHEGIALMCLAEALLRIPDAATADRMIRDKIGGAAWDQYLGRADDLFVNASTWALMLTGKVVADPADEDEKPSSVAAFAGRLVSKLGEPVVRQAMLHAMKIMGQQFVLGRTIDEAMARAARAEENGYRHSYDMLGEGARTMEDAALYYASYESAIDAIGRHAGGRGAVHAAGISIKLSALHPRYEFAQRDICMPFLSDRLLQLARKCAHYNIGLTVDAEEAHRLDLSLDIFENVFADATLKNWDGFGLAVQAYQKRCAQVLERLSALAETHKRKIMVRLVKGAYWDSEIKYAQVAGLDGYPVFTRKAATDVSYIAHAATLLRRRDLFYPMFATHNAHTVATVIELAGADQTGFEFQRLHGMGEPLYHQITGTDAGKYPCRVYAPVGNHQDLLPYLVRRLLENGANTNFVNRLQDDKVPVAEILEDPIDYIAAQADKKHPKIPLPADIYGDSRKNARGIEFADTAISTPWFAAVKTAADKLLTAAHNGSQQSLDPADHRRVIGAQTPATAADIARTLNAAQVSFPVWSATPAVTRAAALQRAADIMEAESAQLAALCIREGGKTHGDTIAEIREAVDFCRYYAAEGIKHFSVPQKLAGPTGEDNTLMLDGRGVFLCISPWNFPLAIFTGQIAAALMAGNTVIAKPAAQTGLIARVAVDIFHRAGIPADALHCVYASGSDTGKYIVPDPRIAGVCFTGSTATAQTINRTLAARDGAIVPLIAETGGQNAMIADSSALPEQIVDDVITSAFRSAGQRCSALRVLFLQDVIADKVIAMLRGACQTLRIGDPMDISTDIGPVIDRTQLNMLHAHAEKMTATAKPVAEVPMPPHLDHGTFFAPRAFEIGHMRVLKEEVFGPILHIIRYNAADIDKVIAQINASGYGLTFGVHSRIDHVVARLTRKIAAGNHYVNRSMIGAVVGVQPFGGQGLSGTGPKAGGPHYLFRFATEKTVSINTTASGGNTTLVSLAE